MLDTAFFFTISPNSQISLGAEGGDLNWDIEDLVSSLGPYIK